MKNKIYLVLVLISIISCTKTKKDDRNSADTTNEAIAINNESVKSETQPDVKNWYDAIIADYVKKSDNQLIKLALKNKEQVEWLLDRTEKTDSTNYYIFNIGQNVMDENNTNPRFTSDGWIYIDSLSKKVYEYDLPNDSLIVWKNKHFQQ